MTDWEAILREAERLATQFRRLEVDLAEAEKIGDYYVYKEYNEGAMLHYLEMMARNPPPRSRRSQRHFKSLWDIWQSWQPSLPGPDKAKAWGWGVRIAKALRGA
ncbi:MAG TPA: hypothetical protein EYP09_01370 [Anaerolineae bacterium]|nr:hypothetical protein [Anaerolineae bacterium]